MPDWRNPDDYAFAAGLDAGQWAWEFLRRHPGYRADWAWFSATWAALEADYGRPPDRDFQRWKHDPRAWRDERELAGCGIGEACASDDGERVLIECWMGQKWGFYKFPPDPADDRRGDEPVTWRETPDPVQVLDAGDTEHLVPGSPKVALGFDLARPIKPQFEDARRLLTVLQRRLRQEGALEAYTVAGRRQLWTTSLRLLDAETAGAEPAELASALAPNSDLEGLRTETRHWLENYRDILTFSP